MKNIKKYTLMAALIVPSFFALTSKSEAAKAIKDVDKAKIVGVRSEAKLKSKVIGTIDDDTEYEITGVNGNFLEIDFQGKKGFVSSSLFKQIEDTKTISPANFRKEANLDSEVIEVLDADESVTILEILDNGFVKVRYEDKEGYISLDLLAIYEEILQAQQDYINQIQANSQDLNTNDYQVSNNTYVSSSNSNNSYYSSAYSYSSPSTNTSKNATILNANTSGIYSYAAQFVGNSYVWGGNSLTNGTDCSGFTQSVYSNYGVNLPHNAQAQYSYGESVNVNEAKEGDLVFYGTSENNITHVAIADGNGGIVHAANPSSGITTASIGNPIGVKRVTENAETSTSDNSSVSESQATSEASSQEVEISEEN